MVQIVGKYHHESNENLDEYFKGVGVPFIPRKLILASHPEMIISLNDDTNEWTISTNSLFRITQITFKLGIEYEEQMPSVTLKSTTNLEADKLITSTISPDGTKTTRTYDFNETHCILTMKLEDKNIVAKRYYRRA